jgi:uncharacterized membrane protein YphA (DoxX/SURF4 family)
MLYKCALAGLRIYVGAIFAFAAIPKLTAGAAYPAMMTGFLTNVGLQNAHPFYRQILSDLIVPHAAAFAVLVVAAESGIALALITGTATRLAAVVAMFLSTNYMFAKGLWWWNPSSNDGAFFMIALVLAICAAGRTFGIDAVLARRWPKSVVW